jgi:hypothetical protein
MKKWNFEMRTVFIKWKGEKLGTLNTVVIFYFLYHSIAKTFLLKDLQTKIHCLNFFSFGSFFQQQKSTTFEIHIAKKLLSRETWKFYQC